MFASARLVFSRNNEINVITLCANHRRRANEILLPFDRREVSNRADLQSRATLTAGRSNLSESVNNEAIMNQNNFALAKDALLAQTVRDCLRDGNDPMNAAQW